MTEPMALDAKALEAARKLFTYQRTFNAIGAAVTRNETGIGISVKAFIEAFGSIDPPPAAGEELTPGDRAAFGASDAACVLFPGVGQADERHAYMRGAADAVSATPAARAAVLPENDAARPIVKQRSDFDCGVCCLAMITDRSYEDVLAIVGDAYDPEKGMANTSTALNRLGLPQRFRADQNEPGPSHFFMHRYVVGPEYLRMFAWGRRAMMGVPSLNHSGGSHLIYWDGLRVCDPSVKKTYTAFEQLLPEELTLFREIPYVALKEKT